MDVAHVCLEARSCIYIYIYMAHFWPLTFDCEIENVKLFNGVSWYRYKKV